MLGAPCTHKARALCGCGLKEEGVLVSRLNKSCMLAASQAWSKVSLAQVTPAHTHTTTQQHTPCQVILGEMTQGCSQLRAWLLALELRVWPSIVKNRKQLMKRCVWYISAPLFPHLCYQPQSSYVCLCSPPHPHTTTEQRSCEAEECNHQCQEHGLQVCGTLLSV